MGLQSIGSQTQAPVEKPPEICWSSSLLKRRAPTRLSTRFVSIECSFLIYSKVIISVDKLGEERRNRQNPEMNPIMNRVVSTLPWNLEIIASGICRRRGAVLY